MLFRALWSNKTTRITAIKAAAEGATRRPLSRGAPPLQRRRGSTSSGERGEDGEGGGGGGGGGPFFRRDVRPVSVGGLFTATLGLLGLFHLGIDHETREAARLKEEVEREDRELEERRRRRRERQRRAWEREHQDDGQRQGVAQREEEDPHDRKDKKR